MRLDASLTFHGAAGCVTDSKHLLRVGETRILLDAVQGRRELRRRNGDAPAFDPVWIDQVLITPKPPKTVCLVHGEFGAALRERFGGRTFEPTLHEEISFETLLPDGDLE